MSVAILDTSGHGSSIVVPLVLRLISNRAAGVEPSVVAAWHRRGKREVRQRA